MRACLNTENFGIFLPVFPKKLMKVRVVPAQPDCVGVIQKPREQDVM